MNVITWILQILLAVAFVMAGIMKLATPIEEILAMGEPMAWVNDVPAWLVRFIGGVEILGGLGLVLPSLLKIQPRLAVMAAYGIGLIMILAAVFHGMRGEYPGIINNVVFLVIALFIAWARTSKVPIQGKSTK